jgi:hypothetical protein
MSGLLLAEFAQANQLAEAARAASRANDSLLDAFTPFPVEGIAELLQGRPSRIRVAMFIAGLAMAVIAYGGEFYTAAIDYPYDSGGRPLDAWPAFMLVPFATGILLASVAGLTLFLWETGLPRLHHPLFAVEGFERISQDRFMLAVARPDGEDEKRQVIDRLERSGALTVREVEP